MSAITYIRVGELGDYTWDEWCSSHVVFKANCIDLILKDTESPYLDIFALSRSRLCAGGELSILYDAENLSPLSVSEYLMDLKHWAAGFGFEAVVRAGDIAGNRLNLKLVADEFQAGLLFKSTRHVSFQCRSLFKSVFGAEISEKFWLWKYPLHGKHFSLAVCDADRLVAHFGVIPRLLHQGAETILAAQVCDVMIAPDMRGGIGKGVFSGILQVITGFLGNILDYKNNAHAIAVGFGFPHGRHMKLGFRLGFYKKAGELCELSVVCGARENYPQNNFLPLAFNEGATQVLWNNAWAALKKSSHNYRILDRSWTYCRRRYEFHPQFKYRLLSGPNDSVWVVRVEHNGHWRLMDYIGDVQFFVPNMPLFASFLGEHFKVKKLSLWCLRDFYQLNGLADCSTLVSDSAALAVLSRFDRFIQPDNPWWVTMGDAEFL